MKKQQDILKDIKTQIGLITASLPNIVDPASISCTVKIPYNAIIYRESLIFRIEELARGAVLSYERNDICAAIVLVRALLESVAANWYLMELIKNNQERLESDIHDKILRLLLGHKNKESEMPEAINVMTFLDKVEKKIKGIKSTYENLCEYSHPNWHGTSLLYAKNDYKNLMTTFGKFQRETSCRNLLLNCLSGTLILFEYSYNKTADMMPQFIVICEKSLETDNI